jgi:hypothetical protein
MRILGALAVMLFAGRSVGASAAAIDVSLAPDQPIPHVYVDDPLILELRSEQDLSAAVTVEVSANGQVTTVDLGRIALRGGTIHWQAAPDIPVERGLYHVRVLIDVAGADPIERSAWFCRIDRPIHGATDLLGVNIAEYDAGVLHAVRGVPLRHVRIEAEALAARGPADGAWDAGMILTVAFDLGRLRSAVSLAEELSRRFNDRVASWEVALNGSQAQLEQLVGALRQGGSRTPVGLVAGDAAELDTLLAAGAGRRVTALVLRSDAPAPEEIWAVRSAAERAGREGMPVYVLGRGVAADVDPGDPQLVRQLVLNASAGAARTELDMNVLFADGQIRAGYVSLSAFAHRLGGSTYVGRLDVAPATKGHVFRRQGTWVLVVWSGEASQAAALDLGDATDLQLYDLWNNPRTAPGVVEGRATLQVGPEPSYLCGSGGEVLQRAAAGMARMEAERLAALAQSHEGLPGEMNELLRLALESETGKLDRINFFALLQLIPRVEQDWRAGRIRGATAVPVMAGIARLARHLCVLEEESGEPFLEPLEKTLANCDRYKSRYLTSSGGPTGAFQRGDWLLKEVSRLMAEAESLVDDERMIEANGVAALAEWRARALEVRRAAGGAP